MESKGHDFSILVLRLVAGLMMLSAHGWGKAISFQQIAPNFPDPFGVGPQVSLGLVVFAELICAGLIAVGLFSRLAAIPLIITMAVAAFHIHAADPWAKKELALLYLACYVVIFFAGNGRFSLQRMLKISSQSRIPLLGWLSN